MSRTTHARALEFAQAKGKHGKPAGSLELAETPWSYYGAAASGCRGQLRTVYARFTRPPAQPANTWRNPRRPAWGSVGVYCDGCAAFWPKPPATP